MASDVLRTISRDQEERWQLISEEKYELDKRSEIAHEKEVSKQEGENIGEERGKKEIIDLLKSGKSPEEIIREYGS